MLIKIYFFLYSNVVGNTKAAKLKNFDRATTFRIIPVANIQGMFKWFTSDVMETLPLYLLLKYF